MHIEKVERGETVFSEIDALVRKIADTIAGNRPDIMGAALMDVSARYVCILSDRFGVPREEALEMFIEGLTLMVRDLEKTPPKGQRH